MRRPRYCLQCEIVVSSRHLACPTCGEDTEATPTLTAAERAQGLADRGVDTWDDYEETK